MFEKIIESAKSKLLSHTDLREEYLKADDLLGNPDISEEYKTYFRASIDWWIYEERLMREANVNFASENSEIQTIYDQLDAAYKSAARFDSDDLNLLFSSVTETRLNFLIRPRATLKWFVFRGEPTKSYGEIIKRLSYIADYPYLIDRLKETYTNKAAQKTSETVASVYEFEQQTEKIDKDSIYSLAPDQFTDLCEPMFNFFSENLEESSNGEIPGEALIIFLDDKGLVDVAARLEKKSREENLQFISKEYFLEFINNILSETAFDPNNKSGDEVASSAVSETAGSASQGSSDSTRNLFKKVLDAFETVAFPDSSATNPNPISDNYVSDEKTIQDEEEGSSEVDTNTKIDDASSDNEIVETEEEIIADNNETDIPLGESEEETIADDENIDFEVPPDDEAGTADEREEIVEDTPIPDEFPNNSYLESTTEPDAEVIEKDPDENTELDAEIVDELLDAVDVSLEVVEEETDFNEFEASDFEELEETAETDSEQDEVSDIINEAETQGSEELIEEEVDDIITEGISEEETEEITDDISEEISEKIIDETDIPSDFETVADESDTATEQAISEEDAIPDIPEEPVAADEQAENAAEIADSSEPTEEEVIENISKNFNDEIDDIIANMDKLTYGDSIPPEEAEHDSTLLSEIEKDDTVNFDSCVSEDMLKENYFKKDEDSE